MRLGVPIVFGTYGALDRPAVTYTDRIPTAEQLERTQQN